MSYRYCESYEKLSLIFNGRIDIPGARVVALCCEMIPGMPNIPFQGTPQEILQNFIGMSAAINAECRNITDDRKRVFTAGCLGCVRFRETENVPKSDGLIHYVNISSYPAPCQSKCFYCWVHDWDERFTPAAKIGYDKMLDTIELAERCGLITDETQYQISSGEIAIHPYRDRLMRLIGNKRAHILTNCMKFDADIAANLHNNPNSQINLSIDSGTPATWAKVKGVDNFETVMENLTKYYVACGRPGQITLKYIIFPGINDNYEDFVSLMEIMKVLEVNEVSISRDGRVKYAGDDEYKVNLLGATAYLVAICRKNNFVADISYSFSIDEQKEINLQADEILQKDLI